jgi:NADPH:quinone reductase-like Zn-dependent oxidoreductase
MAANGHTLRAYCKHAGNTSLVTESVLVPECSSNGFLVKVLAASLCHTDHTLLIMEPAPQLPIGHQTILSATRVVVKLLRSVPLLPAAPFKRET